jgi:outer membrane protein assembly factor BamB
MASGPHGTWATTTEDEIPVRWSVSNDVNILWKRVLPEGGQSGIAIWNGRVFFTTNKPLREDTSLEETEGSDIIGYCLNAENGNVEWTVVIPSTKTMPYSGLFSDNSSATPITDGEHVWFINHGGLMLCRDMNGKEVWRRSFESRTRHNAKQCEPILVNDQLLFVTLMIPYGD